MIIYLVKKFIENLKSCVSVKRLLEMKTFHLNVVNDKSAFYRDGKDLALNNTIKSKGSDSPVSQKKHHRSLFANFDVVIFINHYFN